MPHPIPVPLRLVIRQRTEQGHSIADIAKALGLIPRTVRHLVRRFRDHGKEALRPSYVGCTDPQAYVVRKLLDEALRYRQEHPTWGAGLIRVFLQRDHSQDELPAERTLQRWFQAAGLSPAPS